MRRVEGPYNRFYLVYDLEAIRGILGKEAMPMTVTYNKKIGAFSPEIPVGDITFMDGVKAIIAQRKNDFLIEKGMISPDNNYVSGQGVLIHDYKEPTNLLMASQIVKVLDEQYDIKAYTSKFSSPLNGRIAVEDTASSPVAIEQEKAEGRIVGDALHTVLDKGSKSAGSFLSGGYEQSGYGVAAGAVNDGSHAIGREGDQGYYVDTTNIPDGQGGFKPGKQVVIDTVNDMKTFFARRSQRNNKPIRVVIKTGIGGQHTPFQELPAHLKNSIPEEIV